MNTIALITRKKTGCKQYTFCTIDEVKAFISRKPYKNELLTVYPLLHRKLLNPEEMPAEKVPEYLMKALEQGNQRLETCMTLAGTLLRQLEERDQECAYWIISALSKLAISGKEFRTNELLDFICKQMPTAHQQYQEYVNGH